MSFQLDRRDFIRLTGAAASSVAPGVAAARGRAARLTDIFPPVPRCQDLTAVDVRRYDLDLQMSFLVLQGLVNRTRPRLYLTSTEHCDFWLDYYREQFDIPHQRLATAYSLFHLYRDEITGYRLYDPANLHTLNLAATMSHMDRALPVHPKHEEKLRTAGFRRVDDLRGRFWDRYDAYEWGIENLLPHCSKRVVANVCMDRPHWPSHTLNAVDFLVSLGAFHLDCSASRAHPRDMQIIHKVYERLEAPGASLGWHCARDTEHEAVSLAADYGLFAICNLRSPNYSVHPAVGHALTAKYEQPLPPQRVKTCRDVERKVYVAPMYTDGDAAWAMTNHLNRKWTNPERGTLPMNWGFMTSVYHLGPGMLHYYQSTRTDSDYLVAGPSGIGYTYPHLHPDPLPFLRMTRTGMRRMGMRVVNSDFWDPRLAYHGMHPQEFFDLMRRELPEVLGIVRGWSDSFWEPSVLDGGAPIVYSGLAVHRGDDAYQRLNAIVEACPNRPLFIFAYVNHNITLSELTDAATRRPDDIEFLRLDEFMRKLQTAIARGWVGTELYPDKTGCAKLLAAEMRPNWRPALDRVLALEPLAHASRRECLAHFDKRIGGCLPDEIEAAYQFELCQSAAKLIKFACNSRGVAVGIRRQGVRDFLALYAKLPDSRVFAQISDWWHRWESDGVQSLPDLQSATTRLVHAARWLEKANQDWRPL